MAEQEPTGGGSQSIEVVGPSSQRVQQGSSSFEYARHPTFMSTALSFLRPLNRLVVGLPEQLILHTAEIVIPGMKVEDIPDYQVMSKYLSLDQQPQNRAERIADNAGKLFADNLAAAVPLFRGAQISGQAMFEGVAVASRQAPNLFNASTMDKVRAALFEFVKKQPLGSLFVEQLSAASAGVGEQLVTERVGSGTFGTELARTAGAIAGGIAPSLVAPYLPSVMAVRALRRLFSPAAFERKARVSVARSIARSLEPEGRANAARAEQVFSELGVEARPSIAEATAEPSLLASQRRLEREARGSTINVLARRKEQIVDEVMASANRWAPEYTGEEPLLIYEAATGRLNSVRRTIQEEIGDISERQRAFALDLQRADRVGTGATLRERRSELRDAVRKTFRERADNEGINDIGVTFPFDDLKQAVVSRFFEPTSPFANRLKPEVAIAVKDFKADTVTFEDLQAIRTWIGDEYVEAAVSGERRMLRQLDEMRKIFDMYFDNIAPQGGRPELAQNWPKYRADYKEQFIDRFERGVAVRVGQKDRHGDYRLIDEKVADEFLKTEQGVTDFFRLYGNDDAAMVAMRATVLDRARTVAVKDGEVNHLALRKWIENTRWLDQMPGVKQELDNVATSVRALSARESQLRQRAAAIERGTLANALDANPDTIIGAALKDHRVAIHVSNIARRRNSQGALNAMVWDQARAHIRTPDGELPNPGALALWMKNNERSLVRLIGPEHYKDIKNIYEALTIVGRTPMPRGQAGPTSALEQAEQQLGTGIPQLSSRYFAAESGRVGYRYIAVDAASRLFNRLAHRKQDALLYEALFDPKLAHDIALMQGMKRVPASVERRMNAWMFTLGLQDSAGVSDEISQWLEENPR